MEQATVTWTNGEQFVAAGPSGHTPVLDGDRERNSGPSPMELLLLALGGCTGVDVITILHKKQQQVTALEVQVKGERASEPPRVWTKLAVHYRLVGKDIDPDAVEHAIELSRTKYCGAAVTLGKIAEVSWNHTIAEA